ncbi:MAG: CRISPR-associated endonuclease Cas2 [Deltaproteobacteria bacterium]|nr:MAG: CRISPR-associated endonuclease Cas2 [Deltaproteobacteria bacterium]
MHVLICYDISSNRNRGRLHRYLKEFGLNTQKSFFECELDDAGLRRISRELAAFVDEETDSLRIYRICRACQRRVAVSGLGLTIVPVGFRIV